jgi:hypothetical protein
MEVCSSTEMGALGASHLGTGDHGPKAVLQTLTADVLKSGEIECFGKALPPFNVLADFTNRFVWYRCRWVRAWGSRPSRRPAPALACRCTP